MEYRKIWIVHVTRIEIKLQRNIILHDSFFSWNDIVGLCYENFEEIAYGLPNQTFLHVFSTKATYQWFKVHLFHFMFCCNNQNLKTQNEILLEKIVKPNSLLELFELRLKLKYLCMILHIILSIFWRINYFQIMVLN